MGAIIAGVTADLLGLNFAIWLVAVITALSGIVVAIRMSETLNQSVKDCIEPDTVRQKQAGQKVIIVDVRSGSEYESGHIEGAINLPLNELSNTVKNLPKDVLVVTVCNKGGGRSEQAANLLQSKGWMNARWLCGGYLKWNGMGVCG